MFAPLHQVCVYCGSSPGTDPAYAAAAVALGEELAARDIGLVYGGGAVGLMGVVADTVMAMGGRVLGIIPEFLDRREIRNQAITDLRVVATMHERKAMMAAEADAFVALPGGIGTFEELFEALTWTQLGIHAKPVALFEVNGFWDPLVALLERAVADEFLKPDAAAALLRGSTPAEVLDAFAGWQPPDRNKWFGVEADEEGPLGGPTHTDLL